MTDSERTENRPSIPRPTPFYRPPHRRHLVQRRFLAVAAVVLVAWVGYVFVFSDYGLRNLLVLQGREAALEQRIASLTQKRGRLAKEKIALAGDPEAIERVAREKYFLGRPGERTYIFVPVDSMGTPRASQGPSTDSEPGDDVPAPSASSGR